MGLAQAQDLRSLVSVGLSVSAGASQSRAAQTPALQLQRPTRDPALAVIDWDQALADRAQHLAAYRRALVGQTAAVAVQPFSPPLSSRSQDNLRPVHLPVLLPQIGGQVLTRDGGEPGVMLISRAHFYDASFSIDGLSVHVSGTARINHRQPDAALAQALQAQRDGQGLEITRDEGGHTALFSRYGAAYTVSVECASRSDARCRDDSALRDLVARLVVAGGVPETTP